MNLPKYTEKIFETLSKGGFISGNSSNPEMKSMFECLEQNFDPLYQYFSGIGFRLEAGSDYFHFSRFETKADMERKLETAYKWIDILDFFKTVNPSFGAGIVLSPSSIAEQCKVNSELKLKLEAMKKFTGEETLAQRVRKLLETLKEEEMVELESEILDNWKVLSSIHYIERLVEIINVPIEDETAK